MNSSEKTNNNTHPDKVESQIANHQQQLCVVCKSVINSGAKKCIKCGSYQSVIRSFLTGLDIKSLVAVIPIVTLAFVFVKDQIIPPKSELQVVALACSGDKLTIAAANTGKLDALFGGAILVGEQSVNIPLQFEKDSAQELVVQSGKTSIYHLIALDQSGNTLGLNLSAQNPCQYHLKPKTYSADTASNSQLLSCACPNG